MWQKIKDLAKDWKTYVSMIVSVFGAANTYLHFFMPLAPDMRIWATLCVLFVSLIGVGITIATVLGKKSAASDYRSWARWVAGITTVLGFGAWGVYRPILSYLENHASSPMVSQWFDALQTGAYALPFLCWSIALAAVLAALS